MYTCAVCDVRTATTRQLFEASEDAREEEASRERAAAHVLETIAFLDPAETRLTERRDLRGETSGVDGGGGWSSRKGCKVRLLAPLDRDWGGAIRLPIGGRDCLIHLLRENEEIIFKLFRCARNGAELARRTPSIAGPGR